MKVLFIRSTEGISGAEVYTMLLASALRKKKVDVQVLTNFWPFHKKIKKEKIPSTFLFMPVPEAGTLGDFPTIILLFPYFVISFMKKIKDMEKGRKFDTIILESMTEKLFLSPYLRFFGYKIIWIEHGPLFRTNRSWTVKRLYVHKSKWPAKIIAVSKDTMKDLVSGGVEKGKVETIYIGIDSKTGRQEDRKTKHKNLVVGFVGGLNTEKGFPEFFHAAQVLIPKYKNVTFLALGDGPRLDWARNRIKELQLGKQFTCPGFVDDPKPYQKTMDILYFPTRHQEGISLGILEAMAMGTVVIARDIGGNRELILDKKTGFLFRTDKEGEKILEKAISGKIALRPVKNRAISHVKKHFSMQSQASAFLSAFNA